MGMSYFAMFKDWRDSFDELSDSEAGRLIKAVYAYACGDEANLTGVERGAFGFIRRSIDRDEAKYAEKCETASRSAKARYMRTHANACERSLDGYKNCERIQEEEEEKEEEKEKHKHKRLDDDDGDRAREEQDPVFGYALTELGHLSPTAMEEMSMYRAELPDDLIRWAIDETTSNGTRKWSYTRAILENLTKHGIKTIGEAKAAQDARRQRKGGGKAREQLTSEKVYEDNLAEVFGV